VPNRYLIANWKMNLPPEGVDRYLGTLERAAHGNVRVVVAPPYPFIGRVSEQMAAAAQNCGDRRSGAFTGEVSVTMVGNAGARYVLLGHSERRAIYHEDDAMIARKLALAIDAELTPVVCVGEDLKVRDDGNVAVYLADQIKAVAVPELERVKEVIIAYEPVWAIGTGRNASGAMCAETVDEIRQAVARFWPAAVQTPVLYGGSVTPENVADLHENGQVEGYLVGGASLDSGKMLAILAAMVK
jgi:triosephosphate isomerase